MTMNRNTSRAQRGIQVDKRPDDLGVAQLYGAMAKPGVRLAHHVSKHQATKRKPKRKR